MKYKISLLTLLTLSNAILLASEKPEPFAHAQYSQQELVKTRIAWANQEDRLGMLKYEAASIAANHVVQYVAGSTYVAEINANDKTITTKISPDKSVTLSYTDFSKLLRDAAMIDLANEQLREESNKLKKSLETKHLFGLAKHK